MEDPYIKKYKPSEFYDQFEQDTFSLPVDSEGITATLTITRQGYDAIVAMMSSFEDLVKKGVLDTTAWGQISMDIPGVTMEFSENHERTDNGDEFDADADYEDDDDYYEGEIVVEPCSSDIYLMYDGSELKYFRVTAQDDGAAMWEANAPNIKDLARHFCNGNN